jgi:glyoxylase-like metal-dependent hydrolase (beta-lactamase superfamily II)
MPMNRRQAIAGAAALGAGLLVEKGNAQQARAQQALAQTLPASLTTLRDGGFSLPVSAGAAGRDVGEIRALLQSAGYPSEAASTVLNVSLMRRGKDVILFDCGAGKNFMPGTGELPDRLAAMGVQPEDVTHVLFTHGHPDHLWGALDDFDTPAFPKATYHFPAPEWDDWFAPDIYQRLPEDRHSFAAGAQRILKAIEPVTRRFKAGDEPVTGVLAVAAAGHTPGHCAFEVMADGGPTLIAGDAITHPVISFQRPDWAGGFDADAALASTTRKALLERAVTDRLRLVGYHLPNGGVGRVERAGLAYRFVQG